MISFKRLYIFWYAFEIWNSTVACCDLRSFLKLKFVCIEDINSFWYLIIIRTLTAACCDWRSSLKVKSYFIQETTYCLVCLRNLKVNGGLLQFEVIPQRKIQFNVRSVLILLLKRSQRNVKSLVDKKYPEAGQSAQTRATVSPKSTQSWSKVGQSWPEVIQKSAQSRPKVGQKLAKSPPKVDPKSAQSWPKVCPKSAQRRPKVGPTLVQSRFKVGQAIV